MRKNYDSSSWQGSKHRKESRRWCTTILAKKTEAEITKSSRQDVDVSPDWRNESLPGSQEGGGGGRGDRFGKKSSFRPDPHCLAAACHSFAALLTVSLPLVLSWTVGLPPCPSTRPIRNSNKAVSGVKNVSGPPWITCRKAEPPGHVYLLCSSLLSSPLHSTLFATRDALRAVFPPLPAPLLDNVSRLSERNRRGNYCRW